MNKVLITGGLGFIGLHVAKHLVRIGLSVRLMDNLNPQIHSAIPQLSDSVLNDPRTEVVRGDVTIRRHWEQALNTVDSVVHLAAETGTAQSMYEIQRYTETNVLGTSILLDLLANKDHQVRKVVLASSRSVYGEGAYICGQCGVVYPDGRDAEKLKRNQWDPMCPTCGARIQAIATPESARTSPASIYAATKLAQEDLIRIATKALGIPAVIFRFQNVYGEGQSLKNPYTGILSIFSNQLRQGKTINLYEDGRESRDFVYVSDVARAVGLGLTSDGADGVTLNVGSGHPTRVEQIALLLKDRLGVKTQPVVSGQYRLGDIRHGYADITAIRARLGFVPEVELDHGLDRFVTWVKTQPLEPDRLDTASEELVSRGLMAERVATEEAPV